MPQISLLRGVGSAAELINWRSFWGRLRSQKTVKKKVLQSVHRSSKTGAPGSQKTAQNHKKMGSGRHSTKRAPTGRRIARPGTLKIAIIYSSVIKKQSFHTCPKTAKKSPKWLPKWSQNHLNSVPDTCLQKPKNRVWKSARIWAPRVPKLSPKMRQKSSKIRSRAP